MSGTIFLIVEGQFDAAIVAAILKHHYPGISVRERRPSGKQLGVSRLAANLEEIIEAVKKERGKNDCIAVLHDADLQIRPNERSDYEAIQRICEKHKRDVVLVIAKDEIESWLLADAGLCKWLNTKPQNYDNQKQPSETLKSLLDKAGKPKYRQDKLPEILKHIDGSGANLSPSMRDALSNLQGKPCTQNVD